MKNILLFSSIILSSFCPSHLFDNTPQTLPFSQNWANTLLITADDDWLGVPGIIAYRGDDITTSTGTDPQTLLADGAATPVDVIANQTNPNLLATGGVAEFDGIANPTVALQGSGTADAPHLVINLNTTGLVSINIAYDVRDIDGSADNAVQQVALQYRVGNSGNFTNVPAGYIPDATTANAATQVTAISTLLPAAVDNQPLVQVRIITTNALGVDEWVGIDNISITSGPIPITFISFTARENNSSVYLNWHAYSTDNVSFFIVERKDQANYTEITRLDAITGDHTYAYNDNSITVNSFYRLKMVDADGRYKYSPVLRVEKGKKGLVLNSIFPTVAGSQISLQVSSDKKVTALLQVLDINGKPVMKQIMKLEDAVSNYSVSTAKLPAGNYVVQLIVNDIKLNGRFIKQ
ncbi:MAG TPA: T9SS type A sorting domain-containing protein [Ferruginibacter sp.]|nr:T9SS type A sorting domain-containing protein [Ferruginibacter sp.]